MAVDKEFETKMAGHSADPGAWIQTYSGRAFPLLHPQPSDVCIEDIAHALSNLCRFAGHTNEFYSVAQHSVLVSRHVPAEDALHALLHDAPEAYIVDLPRPLKRSGKVDGYREVEERLWNVIAEAFYLFPEMPSSVKVADNRALFTEQRDLMGRPPKPWQDPHAPFEAGIMPMPPRAAKKVFMERFERLVIERGERLRIAKVQRGKAQ